MRKGKCVSIDPKHGLNPSMGQCFWCGEEDGTIVLLGNMGGKEAPRHIVTSYVPCTACKEKMETGVTLMQASTTPSYPNQVPMQKDAYPTGKWVVVTQECAERIFNHDAKYTKAFLDVEAWEKIGLE